MSAHYQQHASYAQAPYAHNYYAVPVIAHPVARQQNYVQPPLHVQLAPAQLITRRCNDCNRGFAGSAELEQHQNFGRAIQCGVCLMYCSCWDTLALHQTSRHASPAQQLSPGPESPASPRSPGA